MSDYPMAMTAFVDQVARDDAQKALAEIKGHEDVCLARYTNIHDKLGSITRLIGWGGTVLAGLVISVIGFLSVRVLDAPDPDKIRLQAQVEILQAQSRAPEPAAR